ncbi:MAG: AmmeMemoRadiSam system protein B [Desulfobacterales bacterium]|nr:AmmeMemoRadiSam system protein B [Desulfobacterales bacterium]
MKVRKAILAGSWYPESASECEREINNFLNDATTLSPSSKNKLTGGIAPHAGWYFQAVLPVMTRWLTAYRN